MKEIMSIDIALENCEVITVKAEHIKYLKLHNIGRSITKFNYSNSFENTLQSEGLFLRISSASNTYDSFTCTWDDGEVTPFQRLQEHLDIVAININYTNGDKEYIYAPWGGNSDYVNEYQTIAIHKDTGDMYIAVSEKHKVEEYFEYYLKF